MRTTLLAASIACLLIGAPAAWAVRLAGDGLGQALIFPYYTMRSASGNPFNTYVSVVNHTSQAKALRVRVREARNSREVASFNLFLGPNDVWTGALADFSSGAGPRLISADRSCVSPAFTATVEDPPGVRLGDTFYSGVFDDGFGQGVDRTREGWIEVLEMATVTGTLAAAVTHNSATGAPNNCAATLSPSAGEIAAPAGGLSGTLTLINVANGRDFTVNAEALADLGTRSFYRPAADAYPDFNAVEIDAVSVVVANGSLYRSAWNRPVDAVSAVLMRSMWMGEFVLDVDTRSQSDFVVTFPTRQHYFAGTSASAPFSGRCAAPSDTFAGEPATLRYFDRSERTGTYREVFFPTSPPPVTNFRCSATAVFSFAASGQPDRTTSHVLGSTNIALTEGVVTMPATSVNGWAEVRTTATASLTSLPSSTRTSLASGTTTTGSHAYLGLPVVGFTVRTFENGTLVCGTSACQGNYGGSFPLKFRRSIAP